MSSCARMATSLDHWMLKGHGVEAVASATRDADLPEKSGDQVFEETGRRYLIRYVPKDGISLESMLEPSPRWVTPTPYSAEDAVRYLALPFGERQREYYWLINPRYLRNVKGPRSIDGGFGIEYLIPEGVPEGALVKRFALPVD
jgi:hypothetical protein